MLFLWVKIVGCLISVIYNEFVWVNSIWLCVILVLWKIEFDVIFKIDCVLIFGLIWIKLLINFCFLIEFIWL